MTDILLIEDNQELGDLIKVFLERDGWRVVLLASGEEGISFLEKEKVKLILLDIMLTGMDGFAFCSRIRKHSNIPVIIMSARVEKEDMMNGFTIGADDYVEKPVDMDILCVKVRAFMRRSYELKQENVMIFSGEIAIDKEAKQVFWKDRQIAMTQKEYELLVLLAENPGKALNKEHLFAQIWGAESFSENQTLTVHVKMLRDKIEEDPRNPMRIRTVWGVGYRYEEI